MTGGGSSGVCSGTPPKIGPGSGRIRLSQFGKQINVMGQRHIRVRTQTAFQMVLPDVAKQRIERIDAQAALKAAQVLGQRQNRDRRIVARAEEEGEGEALPPGDGAITSCTSARTAQIGQKHQKHRGLHEVFLPSGEPAPILPACHAQLPARSHPS